MNEILQTNIFFFITAVVMVVVGIFLTVALWYLIRILRDIKTVSEVVRKEMYLFGEDIADVREYVREEGVKIKHFISFIGAFVSMGRVIKKGRKHKSEKTYNEEKL